jgi:hypothetical protein
MFTDAALGHNRFEGPHFFIPAAICGGVSALYVAAVLVGGSRTDRCRRAHVAHQEWLRGDLGDDEYTDEEEEE